MRILKWVERLTPKVLNKGQKDKGIKIRSKTKAEMEDAAKRYAGSKDVVILGEYRNEEWVK